MRFLILLPGVFGFCGATPVPAVYLDAATRSVIAARAELPPIIWKRVLEVCDAAGTAAEHYLVFNLHHTYFCYSARGGSRRIWPQGESQAAFACAILPSFRGTARFIDPVIPPARD